MPKELQTYGSVFDLAEFKRLLGRPIILSTESLEAYEAMLVGFMKSLAPRNFLEQMMIRNLVDAMWDIQRYQRHKTISIERRFQEYKAHAQKRQKTIDERKASIAKGLADAARVASEVDRAELLEGVVDASVSEVDNICDEWPTDVDQSRALEAGLEVQERIDRLLNDAYVRRRRGLEDLEHYRAGLGRYAEEIAQIVEGEFEETRRLTADREVPLAPLTGGEPDDLCAQAHGKSN